MRSRAFHFSALPGALDALQEQRGSRCSNPLTLREKQTGNMHGEAGLPACLERQGAGTRQALTAAFRRSARDRAMCQPRTARPAEHQAPFCPAAFRHAQPVRVSGAAWLYLSWPWNAFGVGAGAAAVGCSLVGRWLSHGDAPVLAVGPGSSMCFQAES